MRLNKPTLIIRRHTAVNTLKFTQN